MWLLIVFLLLQSVVCLYHDINTQTYWHIDATAKNRYWRDEIGRRRDASFTIDNEGIEMEKVPVLHYLRLAGIVLIVAQFSFLLYFTARTVREETDAMRQQEFFQLIDTPRIGKHMKKEYALKIEKEKREKEKREKEMRENEEQAKLATVMGLMKPEVIMKEEVPRKVEEPKHVSIMTLKKTVAKDETKKSKDTWKRTRPEVAMDDLKTAVERKTLTKRTPSPGVQSQRYPRAKKGHQTEFLEEMEEFLVGDEARELEKSQISDPTRQDERASKMERASKQEKDNKNGGAGKMEKDIKNEERSKKEKVSKKEKGSTKERGSKQERGSKNETVNKTVDGSKKEKVSKKEKGSRYEKGNKTVEGSKKEKVSRKERASKMESKMDKMESKIENENKAENSAKERKSKVERDASKMKTSLTMAVNPN